MKNLAFSWFDVVVVALICVGFWRGRRNGLSNEFIPMLMWLGISVGGALLYKPLGQFLAGFNVFSLLSSYLAAYIGFAIIVAILFSMLKKALGDKLASSDFFGRIEYYGGTVAGAIRFLAITLFVFSLIGARKITAQELEATARMQKQNFEGISFPTFGSVQQDVIYASFTGTLIRENAPFLMIEPTVPEAKALGGGKREDVIDRISK